MSVLEAAAAPRFYTVLWFCRSLQLVAAGTCSSWVPKFV